MYCTRTWQNVKHSFSTFIFNIHFQHSFFFVYFCLCLHLSLLFQLPKFFYLCEDGVWGVRKACADVFMPVSCVCSPTVRQTELSPIFINLLRDQSRWVRMAAFQALGPFISTFADPAITALLHNENGEIVITDPDQLAERWRIIYIFLLPILRSLAMGIKNCNFNLQNTFDILEPCAFLPIDWIA